MRNIAPRERPRMRGLDPALDAFTEFSTRPSRDFVHVLRREVSHMPEQRQIGEKYWGVCWKWGFIPIPCRKTRR
jgi:hypothetical protein